MTTNHDDQPCSSQQQTRTSRALFSRWIAIVLLAARTIFTFFREASTRSFRSLQQALHEEPDPHRVLPLRAQSALALSALGVVYGDIGTSPLYAVRQCFARVHIPFSPHSSFQLPVTEDNIFGVISLISLALFLVVAIKYIFFLPKADNHGEGGIVALMAKIAGILSGQDASKERREHKIRLLLLGLFGACLLYGDGVITPSISVLSAVEGLSAHPAWTFTQAQIVNITCGILAVLFLFQRFGTGKIGFLFGPIMLVWFIVLGVLGLRWIVQDPRILLSIVDPRYGFRFLANNTALGMTILFVALMLGSVVLCITGGEALYADMGHFGKRAIRQAWFALVYPALILNYAGQGALLLNHPEAVTNPFFHLTSTLSVTYPLLVLLSMAATVIASQALITGAFSLTSQLVQLGLIFKQRIEHTNETHEGQIYLPGVNLLLLVGCLVLTRHFGRSEDLAAAYGIAVTGTMGITSILYGYYLRYCRGWNLKSVYALTGLFLIFDLSFFLANLLKIAEGGWVPLAIAGMIFFFTTTWRRGRETLERKLSASSPELELIMRDIGGDRIHRFSGIGVFLTSNNRKAPSYFLHHLLTNGQHLQETVLFLSLLTNKEEPYCKGNPGWLETIDLGCGVKRVTARYGFMESLTVTEVMTHLDLPCPLGQISYFLGRDQLEVRPLTFRAQREPRVDRSENSLDDSLNFIRRERASFLSFIRAWWNKGMFPWRLRVFVIMSTLALKTPRFFDLPAGRTTEIGIKIEL